MANAEKSTILLIDDDTNLLLTLSDFLSFEGYNIATADSGEQGLKRLKSITPDLIILDMSMPGMGGMGFLNEIADDGGSPKHPVLVLTARANMEEFFEDMAVDGFISKPCEPNALLDEVSRILLLHGATASGDEDAGASERKVLIGEDDGAICHRLLEAFKEAGYKTESVSKGPDILEKALVQRPDLIVLKLVLTGMNGDAVADMLKEMPNTKGIPVLLYDDSNSLAPDGKYTKAGTGITVFVRSSDASSLVTAAGEVLGV